MKYYQVSVEKSKLMMDSVSLYIQQAYQIWDTLKKPGSNEKEGGLFYGENRDQVVMEIAKMIRDEDHFIRSIEEKPKKK